MTDAEFRALLADMGASWPPVAMHRHGPWVLREGGGGGSRVSSATAGGAVGAADIAALEDGAARLGQRPQVMVRPGEAALDMVLAAAGYAMQDETLLYAIPADDLPPPPVMTAFAIWPPLEVQRQLWAGAGVGAARQAVMERATGPKAAILGRAHDRVAGAAFVARGGDHAFLHAVAVLPELRRAGCGRHMLLCAAEWARSVGAGHLALAVTRANEGARALYASQGMQVVGQYHYRIK